LIGGGNRFSEKHALGPDPEDHAPPTEPQSILAQHKPGNGNATTRLYHIGWQYGRRLAAPGSGTYMDFGRCHDEVIGVVRLLPGHVLGLGREFFEPWRWS
jgi:hypothetical protein